MSAVCGLDPITAQFMVVVRAACLCAVLGWEEIRHEGGPGCFGVTADLTTSRRLNPLWTIAVYRIVDG